MKSRSSFTKYLAGSLAVAGFSQSASAVDYTWDGGGSDDNWGTGENWSPDGAPSPSSTSNLIFAGTTRLGAINNYGDGDDFNDITFASGAGAFTISNTGSNGIDWFGTILNSSTNTQTIGFRLYQSASNTINAASGDIRLNSSALLFRNGQALTLTAASTKTIQIDSVIADGGGGAGSAILVDGVGTVRLNGANTFTSGVNVTNGVLSISAANNVGTGGITLNGGTLRSTAGGNLDTNAITIGASGGTINSVHTGGTFRFQSADRLLGSGTLTITGNGTLPLAGSPIAGVVVLNASNTYNGNVIVQDGGLLEYANATGMAAGATVTVGNTGGLSSAGQNITHAVTVNSGGTLLFQNNNNGNFSGNITLNGATAVRMQDWYAATVRNGLISGAIGGTGSLAVNSGSGSGGVLTLTNAGNSYSGTTTITASTLQLGNGGTTGGLSASSAITNNGTLTINRSNAVAQGTDFSSAAITGTGAFMQAGAGTTTLNTANTFTGATTLTAGTLSVADTSYLGGASANNSLVFNGGTLQVTGTSMTSLGSHAPTYNANKTAGFDINNAANNFNAGSTVFNTTTTLLKTGAGTLTLGAASNTLKNVQLNQGTLDLGSNNLTISNVGSTTINNATTNSVTINATGGGKIVLTQNNATDGPDIGAANGGTLTINAGITGTSAFESWGGTANGTGVTVLTGQNDYTGNTIINTGVLSVSNIGNTGSTTSNLGQASTINISSTSAGNNQNSTLRYTGAGETTNRVVNFFLNGNNTGGIIDQSGTSGLLKFTSNQTSTGTGSKTLTLQGSTVGAGEFAGNIVNGSGTVGVTKAGTGTWTLSGTGSTYSGGTRANGGTLTISGSVVNSGSFVSVNNVGATNATLKVVSGATLGMSDFNMGEAVNSRAAIFQSGGAITVNNNTGGAFRLGNNTGSYGYYNMSGGTLDLAGAAGEFGVGGDANSTVGVMDVSGGTITTKSWILLGRGGQAGSTSSGLLNITGGSLSHTSNQIGMAWAAASGATSIINVGGGSGAAALTGYNTATVSGTTGIDLARTSITGQLGAVNLLTNGTLTVSNVQASGANTQTLLNFNGGTLKATATNAGTSFLTAANLDAVHVYSGGGTIHNNGTAITIGNALLTNSGTGITNIAVTNGGSGYIGAPLVEISGGTGATATAYANMVDDGTGNGTFKIGSITVTSNGVYTVAPTTVSLTGGGASTAATIGAITTGANVITGGMTFQGAGTTTLGGANTYNGGTTVSAGTLDVTGTLADTGAVNVSGGTYKVSNDDTVGAVTLTSGTISNASGKVLTGSSYAVQSGTVSGILGGSGALTKSTSGTVTLSGANTYAGATAVTAGKLVVNGSITSHTTVSSGATLGGSGTIQGNLTLGAESSSNAGDGGTLAAGNSPGVLTATGTTTFDTGSIFSWDLDTNQISPETNRGVAYDGVNTDAVSGGNAIFGILLDGSQDFSSLFWQQDRSWSDIFKDENGTSVLSNWASVFTSFTYSNANGALAPSAYGSFSLSGNTLSWSAVPEPGSAVAGFLIVAGLLRRRR